jgi:ABC-2 type transport system ATP-binding protein
MLKLKLVSKSYGSGPKAVDSLDLHVRSGEIFGFLGPNGAGKTTTIKMVVGVLRPDEGSIEIGGADLAKQPTAAKVKTGYVPDEAALWDKLTGVEYLNFMGDVYGVPGDEREERVKAAPGYVRDDQGRARPNRQLLQRHEAEDSVGGGR